jgi:hypothetical protein
MSKHKPGTASRLGDIATSLESSAIIMSQCQITLAGINHTKATELKRLRDRLNSLIRNLKEQHERSQRSSGGHSGTD